MAENIGMATKMPSPPAHYVDERNHSLFSLPPEVTTEIFGNLPSFFDVFALAATCRRLRDVWSTSVIPIYNSVARRSIAYERDARRFLVYQHGLKLESPMIAETVVQMVRNATIVEKAVLQFEREIVSRVRSKFTLEVLVIGPILTFKLTANGFSPEKFYGAEARGHPPTMTDTERTRFVRTYYSLWGLMKLNPAEWAPRLESMTSQQLYHLHEMTKLTQSIGHEEDIPPSPNANEPPDSFLAINFGQSEKRIALEDRVRERIQHISQRFFQRDAAHTIVYAKREGFLFFVVFWDHWQPSLKELVCHQSMSVIRPNSEETRRYLWDDNFIDES